MGLTITVIVFAVVVLILEVILVRITRAIWMPYSVIRMIGLTLILLAAMIVLVNFDGAPITGVVGLLGTIAGYLLGKDGGAADLISEADKRGPNDGAGGQPAQPAGAQ